MSEIIKLRRRIVWKEKMNALITLSSIFIFLLFLLPYELPVFSLLVFAFVLFSVTLLSFGQRTFIDLDKGIIDVKSTVLFFIDERTTATYTKQMFNRIKIEEFKEEEGRVLQKNKKFLISLISKNEFDFGLDLIVFRDYKSAKNLAINIESKWGYQIENCCKGNY